MKFDHLIQWVLVFMVSLSPLAAQTQGAFPDVKLGTIKVEGNSLTSDNMIRYTSGLQEGQTLAPGDFARAVNRLWQLDLFGDIQILLDRETEEQVDITILVQENPIAGDISFEGNKKLKDDTLEEALGVSTGQRIQPNTLTEMTQTLKDKYAEDGYLLAEIEPELIPTKKENLPNEIYRERTRDIIFHIEEGKKVKIRDIAIHGNEAFSDWRLRRAMKDTKQQRWYLFWRSAFDQDKYQDDLDNLRTFYKNHGYRDVSILADSISYGKKHKRMDIDITIEEGPQYHFRNFSWEGNSLFTEDELRRALDIDRGEIYNEETFQMAVYDRMQGLYMDRGYIYSQINPQVTPVKDDSLDVHFVIQENHKVHVRNIYIAGNTKTRENVIRRELKIYPGDVFNRNKLIRSQREIWILNYFSNVVPEVLPVDDDEVDLEIAVEEKSSDRANVNVGFTGEYGMTGGGGVEFNNFRGLGQSLNLSFNVGTNYSLYTNTTPSKYRSFSLSFTDPMIWDTPNLVGFSLFYTFRGASTNYSFPLDFSMRGSSLTWGRRFKWPDDFFRGTWNFGVVQKQYEGTQQELDTYIGGLNKSQGIALSQTITRDSRDRPEFTTRGSKMVWKTKVSGGILGGNEDFHKHVLNLEWYTPTFWKFVLMSSVKVGVIRPFVAQDDEQSIIPFDERFILGGNGIPYGNMLRGYPDNQVGPLTSTGRPLGGNTLFKFTSEFRIPFSENPVVYGLLFAEAGNVWSGPELMEPFYLERTGPLNLKRSAGVGIRFFMPMIGMLGFDMGYGFDDITGDGKPEGWTYTITFGQPF